MRRATLDGTLKDLDAVYDAIYTPLSVGLDVPAFGHNLDALWDVLTTSIPGPIEIVWKDYARARKRIGKRLDRLVKTLREAAEQRADLDVRIE